METQNVEVNILMPVMMQTLTLEATIATNLTPETSELIKTENTALLVNLKKETFSKPLTIDQIEKKLDKILAEVLIESKDILTGLA